MLGKTSYSCHMIFRILFWRGEVHTSLSVFAGVKEGALGSCGNLVMRNEEFDAFRDLDAQFNYIDMYVKPADPPEPKTRGRR
jgi:hypothetical protein